MVDPCRPGQGQDLEVAGGADTVGVLGSSRGQRVGTFLCNPVREAVVHVGWGVELYARVLVVMIVPIHEAADAGPRITRDAKRGPRWKASPRTTTTSIGNPGSGTTPRPACTRSRPSPCTTNARPPWTGPTERTRAVRSPTGGAPAAADGGDHRPGEKGRALDPLMTTTTSHLI